MMSSTMKQKIFVLGSNSFSGQDFVDLALDQGRYEVIGVSRSAEPSPFFLKYRSNPKIENFKFYQCDMNHHMSQLCELLDSEKPEYIVNFAAQSEVAPSWEHPEHWFQTNTVALSLLVNHLRKQSYLKRYLHVSSPEAYGTCVGRVTETTPDNPSTPYAASKAAADMLLSVYHKQYGFPLLTVRSTNVYGARQQLFKIIPRSVIYCRMKKKIELHGGGHAVKSYIHIRDISRGELAILEKGNIGERYHLSPDGGVSVREIVSMLCELQGLSFDQQCVSVAERPGQDAAYVIDSAKARSELGWKPEISIHEGLKETSDWVEKHWDEITKQSLQYVHKA